MIKITVFMARNKVNGFSVKGHSHTAPHGEDIVCAGISSLAQTALLGLTEHLKRQTDYKVQSGDLSVKLLSAPDELSEAILRTTLLGMSAIAEEYPKVVQIKMIHEG